MPVVSQIEIPRTPRSAKRCTYCSTTDWGTSPSIGQPKAVDKDTLIGVLPSTKRITSAKAATLFSRSIRKLARLWVSEVDMTKLNSSARDSNARSAPRKFGTKTVYSTP